MAGFYGRYEHSLDGKGRVILPVKFRGPFERGGFLTAYQDGCLALWTPDQFEVQSQSWLERATDGPGRAQHGPPLGIDLTRAGHRSAGPDGHPPQLREYAGLEGDVLVLGAIDRVELWNGTNWTEKVAPQGERLTQGVDG